MIQTVASSDSSSGTETIMWMDVQIVVFRKIFLHEKDFNKHKA